MTNKTNLIGNMFGNRDGFGFNVSFVDRASMFVESVVETSLSFCCVLQMPAVTLSYSKLIFAITVHV